MRGLDRFLVGILAAVVLMVVIAVILVVRTSAPQEATYGDDSTPEGVVRNYLVAVQKGDEVRAKSYLAQEVLDQFAEREGKGWTLIPPVSRPNDSSQRVHMEKVEISDGVARVTVSITTFFASRQVPLPGLFSANEYTRTSVITLRQFGGKWLIVKPFEPYMLYGGGAPVVVPQPVM